MDSRSPKKRSRSRSPCVSQNKASKKRKKKSQGRSSCNSPVKKHSFNGKYRTEILDKKKKERKKKIRKKKASTSSSSESSSSSTTSSSSPSSSSNTSSDDSSENNFKFKKSSHKKKTRKQMKDKKEKKNKKIKKKKSCKIKCQETKDLSKKQSPGPSLNLCHKRSPEDLGPVLSDEQKSRIQAMKPMTKDEWDARQSVIRRVIDPETGRMRLIKGDGEVLEEIVSKERHQEINKQATKNDGLAFQMYTGMF
ncbi:hypothetical protein GDO86_002017 [Hymenochirus boettgeri]|uniref:ADP-ribosylation factor-like protein 6-interacting protein 4 n=1 Tax=Hymenochirus boettgeri TaxID=247094 RepID=A0A8T2KF51_9PIPI|nr:hypothetical protein GDO86_002017 [Hymenochirus boettgeri]